MSLHPKQAPMDHQFGASHPRQHYKQHYEFMYATVACMYGGVHMLIVDVSNVDSGNTIDDNVIGDGNSDDSDEFDGSRDDSSDGE